MCVQKNRDQRRPNTFMFVLICLTSFETQGFEISRNPPNPYFAETLRQLCCLEETRFPAIKEINRKNQQKTKVIWPKSKRFRNHSIWQSFFQNHFFRNISKTVPGIEKMKNIKFIYLWISNNLLSWHILISRTVFEIQRLEKNVKNTPIPNFGEILPWMCRPGETLDS